MFAAAARGPQRWSPQHALEARDLDHRARCRTGALHVEGAYRGAPIPVAENRAVIAGFKRCIRVARPRGDARELFHVATI